MFLCNELQPKPKIQLSSLTQCDQVEHLLVHNTVDKYWIYINLQTKTGLCILYTCLIQQDNEWHNKICFQLFVFEA